MKSKMLKKGSTKQSDFSKRVPEISLPHAKRDVSLLKVVFKRGPRFIFFAFNIC
jgi:hypothetical protein